MQNYPNQPPYGTQQPTYGQPQAPGPMPPYPQSGYPQQPPPLQQEPPKKKKSKLGIGCGIVTAVVVLIIVIAAVSNHSDNTGTAVKSSSNSTNNPSTSAQTSQQHFKVGDTVKVGTTWQAVVNSVKTDDGGQYSALKSGDIYVIVDISLTNLSNQEQNVSSIVNFTLQDSTGQKYDESVDGNAGATLDGKVEAGQPLRGIIAYEVPSSIKQFRFNFESDIVSAGQTTWDLSVS